MYLPSLQNSFSKLVSKINFLYHFKSWNRGKIWESKKWYHGDEMKLSPVISQVTKNKNKNEGKTLKNTMMGHYLILANILTLYTKEIKPN